MKKIYTTDKYKRVNSSRSVRRLRNRTKRKNKIYIPEKGTTAPVKKKKRKVVQNVEAPEEFSLIDNTEEVLAYFKSAREFLSDGHPIRFDISKIKTLTPGTKSTKS